MRIPGCRSITEVLSHIQHGGPEWTYRHVTLWFPGPSNAWVLVYPLQGTREPYFDFMYTRKESPQATLSNVLDKYPQCSVIDWSPGRLACISAADVDVETLAKIIQDVAQVAWGERSTHVEASYEEMPRA